MEITRETVNDWMDAHHRDRDWLAEKCKVGVRAVGNWLNKKGEARPIPAEHQITIAALMREDEAASQLKPPHNLVLEFTDSEYSPIERAALGKRLTVREWAKKALEEAAGLDVESFVASLDNVHPMPRKAHVLAAAGSPITAEVLDWDQGDVVQVKISGLSMVPLLNDGDVIEMRHKKTSRSEYMKKGLIYLVAYDGGYTVKRYNTRKATAEEQGEEWVEDGRVKVLESINPDFPEIIIKQPLEWVAWLDSKK